MWTSKQSPTRCRGLKCGNSWDPWKRKLHRKHRACRSSCSRRGFISWNLAKTLKTDLGVIETSTPHRSKLDGIAEYVREEGRRRRRYSPSRRCAGCVAWWSGCRAQCAARGAWERRRGRGRWRSGRSRKGGRWSQRETLMDDCADEVRLKNTLSHEVRVTQTSQERRRLRALSAVLTCATCACRCSCTCCWCSLCHACPHRSCCCSCGKYTVFVASFL